MSSVGSFFSLGVVIDALIATRILVQFMGQIVGLVLLRQRAPDMPRPFRMWLYPIPALIAFLGWAYIFSTTAVHILLFGLGMLMLGIVCFFRFGTTSVLSQSGQRIDA